MDKRRVLFVTQSLLLVLAVILAVLSSTHTATLALVVMLAFLSGGVSSFDQPARSALLPTLVPRDELPHATALNALAMTTAGTIGPALAGLTAATVGLTVNFSLNAAGFLVALTCLASLRADTSPAVAAKQPLLGSVQEGLRIVARDAKLPWIISGYGVLLLLGPSPSVILPLYAAKVLHVDGAQLGVLFLMVGVGTVVASALQAVLSAARQGRVFIVALLAWSGTLVVFALSSSLPLSALALLLHGAARNVVGTAAVTMMQVHAPPEARGRVMSLNTLLAGGVRPLGDFGMSAVMAVSSIVVVTAGSGLLVGLYALMLSGRLNNSNVGRRLHSNDEPAGSQVRRLSAQQGRIRRDIPFSCNATGAGPSRRAHQSILRS